MVTEKDKSKRSLEYDMENADKKPKGASLDYDKNKSVEDYATAVADKSRVYAELQHLGQEGLRRLVSDADNLLRRHTNINYREFLKALPGNVPANYPARDLEKKSLIYLAALSCMEKRGGDVDEILKRGRQNPESHEIFEALEKLGYSPYAVFERQTRLGNLVLLSTTSLADPQSALAISRKVKQLKNRISALSFELDKNLQPFLEALFEERKKSNYDEFPGLGYTIDLCVSNNIPIFASDATQQQYFREIMNLDLKLQKKVGRIPCEGLDEAIREWDKELNKLEEQRARGTAKELRALGKRIVGTVYHVSSERQAEIIDEII